MKNFYSIALLLLGLLIGGYGSLRAQADCSAMGFLGASNNLIGITLPTTNNCTNPTFVIQIQQTGTSSSYTTTNDVTFLNFQGSPIAIIRELDPCTRYDVRVFVLCNGQIIDFCESQGEFQTIGCGMPSCDGVMATQVSDNDAIITVAGFENCRQGPWLLFETQWRPVGSSTWNSGNSQTTATYKHLVGLQPCTDYEYRIRVLCNGDYSDWCTGTFKTKGCPCEDCNLSVNQILQQSPPGCTQSFYVSTTMSSNCTIVSYDFDFGDGNTTTSTSNPTLTRYTESGTYNVCVTVNAVTPKGDTCSVQYCDSIEVTECVDCEECDLQIGHLNIFPSNTSPCTQIALVSSRVYLPCTIQEYVFDWGDGAVSSSSFGIAGHTYTQDGIFNVCATVKADNGNGEICKTTVCKSIFISGCHAGSPEKKAVRKSLHAYPNPVSAGGALTLTVPKGGARVSLLDLNGRTVLDQLIPTGGKQQLPIPEDIAEGMYILVDEAGAFKPQRILVQ